MAWDPHKLARGVVEEFAAAQAVFTNARLAEEWRRSAVFMERERERARLYARDARGGLKGYTYNDGRWRGRRSATRYVQLELPFPVRINMRERLPADRTGVTQKFSILSKITAG